VKLGHLRFIFKGQLSILLRLLEFVRNREFSKLSNKAIAENPHAQLGALLSSCAPLASRASVAHLRCALRDLTWVTLSQIVSPSLLLRYKICPGKTAVVPIQNSTAPSRPGSPTLASAMTGWRHHLHPGSWPRRMHQASPDAVNQSRAVFRCARMMMEVDLVQ
jgi:hypothetical protein